jgi:drug/metabolite transporter (DMT)-like permease
MAGLGLGGSSVAVRAMHLDPGNIFVAVLTEPLVYVLIGLWATGLYNWARALRLGDVATVTALFMTTQVLVPGTVGIVLLGDTVRDGWAPVAVVGVAMALWGVQSLARRKSERRTPARVT